MLSGHGPVILGLHTLGKKFTFFGLNNAVIASGISKELLLSLHNSVDDLDPVIYSEYSNVVSKINPKLGKRSHVDFLAEGEVKNYELFGSVESRASYKSSVELTPLASEVKHFLKHEYSKPDLSWKPFNIALRQYTNPTTIPSDVLRASCQVFHDHVSSVIPAGTVVDYLKPMTIVMAVNGKSCVKFIDGINRSTSAGHPFNRSKLHYLENFSNEDFPDGVLPNEDIMSVYRDMMSQYEKGNRANVVFKATLKDEPVKESKAIAGKTRVFTGAPFPFVIIVRQYYMPVIKFMQENSNVFKIAVGINASNWEWDRFVRNLSKHPNWLDGDYSAFDKGMSRMEITIAIEFMISMAAIFGRYTEKDIRLMHAIKEDMVQALIDYDGSLITFMGGNPSGSPLTVIINCIVNVIRFVAAYITLVKRYDFFKEVELCTYGDDVVATVSDEAGDVYNFRTISEVYKSWNIAFTDASKSDVVQNFNVREDIQFLKRKFRFDSELNRYMAPLDEESIYKSMYIWNRSKSISKEDQLAQILESAHREFFQYGRDLFDNKRGFIEGLYARFSNKQLPTYDEYLKAYQEQEENYSPYEY